MNPGWRCSHCRHLHTEDPNAFPTCDAYPDGIPWDIMTGETDHLEPLADDRGIPYERADRAELERRFAGFGFVPIEPKPYGQLAGRDDLLRLLRRDNERTT